MLLNVLKGKIHRATVTQAELDYVGSITIDSDLMEAAGIMEYELVTISDRRRARQWSHLLEWCGSALGECGR